jgi:hypothetical protein
MMGLAVEWHAAGKISAADRDEIVAMVSAATPIDWRPIVLVIPYGPVAARVKVVPRKDRASQEPEYIIEDLVATEFEVIEPLPLT